MALDWQCRKPQRVARQGQLKGYAALAERLEAARKQWTAIAHPASQPK